MLIKHQQSRSSGKKNKKRGSILMNMDNNKNSELDSELNWIQN